MGSSSGDTSSAEVGLSVEARVKRRREINRNSQRRIRERRNRELEQLKDQVDTLASENDGLRTRMTSLTRERDELLQSVQQLTDKWSAMVTENSAIHKENFELRASLQQLNSLLGMDEALDALVAAPASPLIDTLGAGLLPSPGAVMGAYPQPVGGAC